MPHLVNCAKEGKTITYKEIGDKINCYHRSFYQALYYIRDEFCIKNGHPIISGLVVKVDTQLPGKGWHPNANKWTKQENRKKFEDEKKRIFSYKQWDELLSQL
jgi:hypothetical protein